MSYLPAQAQGFRSPQLELLAGHGRQHCHEGRWSWRPHPWWTPTIIRLQTWAVDCPFLVLTSITRRRKPGLSCMPKCTIPRPAALGHLIRRKVLSAEFVRWKLEQNSTESTLKASSALDVTLERSVRHERAKHVDFFSGAQVILDQGTRESIMTMQAKRLC